MASGYQKNGTQEAMNGMYVVQKQSELYADVIIRELEISMSTMEKSLYKGLSRGGV